LRCRIFKIQNRLQILNFEDTTPSLHAIIDQSGVAGYGPAVVNIFGFLPSAGLGIDIMLAVP
jgi:hypothetical protein